MRHYGAVTLFPDFFAPLVAHGVVGRAIRAGVVDFATFNPRNFCLDRHRSVDDAPFGGGPGMVMRVGPLRAAIAAGRAALHGPRVILLSPQGRRLDQAGVAALAAWPGLLLVCGRYEGIDERLVGRDIDEEWSLGDFVLSGGEPAALALLDAVSRTLPGVLGDAESAARDCFSDGLLAHPQYTRPEILDGEAVPAILLSGHHAEIARWRRKQALGRTAVRRPDLLAARGLSPEEAALLVEYQAERAPAVG